MAQVQFNDVMEALKAADAAGNTEDAAKLAEIASSMMSSEPPQEKAGPTFKSVMGQINKRSQRVQVVW